MLASFPLHAYLAQRVVELGDAHQQRNPDLIAAVVLEFAAELNHALEELMSCAHLYL